jgi:hypothetical protein
MNTLREAAQQAEDVLRGCLEHPDAADAIAALRAALTEPYDQTALELCDVCGWKTLIPGEGCLNCERQPKAEPQSGIKQVVELYDSPEHEPAAVKAAWLAGYTEGQKDAWAAPQPRKRLTREEIVDAVREADLDWHQGWTLDEDALNRYETLCRAIEAAVWGEKT